MKVITSIRLAFAMSLMSLLLVSSISCKKENSTANSPIVGSWLIYQGADDDNNNGKIEDSEWQLLTKADYDLFKSLGFTGETVFKGDGTGYLVTTNGGQEIFKWSIKADGNFQLEDSGSNLGGIFTASPDDTETIYVDAKGDLRNDITRNVTSLGIVTKVVSGIKYKRN